MKKFYFYYFFLLVLFMTSLSCSIDDDTGLPEQYLRANVNGLEFNSGTGITSLIFTREIDPAGRVNLFVRAISEDGDSMEFMIENFQGVGKYYFGNDFYNNNWIKYQKSSVSEEWMLNTGGALHLTSNFIEITQSKDDLIEGKISCKELKSVLEDIFGAVDGDFRLKYIP